MKHYPSPLVRLTRLIPLIAVLLLAGQIQAGMITGYVYTRAPVLSDAGHFIWAEDLRNTDLFVVRVADGRLIAERIGLNEIETNRIRNFGENADTSQFFYTLQMRNSFGISSIA